MKALKLRENFYWTGIVDADLRVFDIIMYTEFGTTYNSYVLKTGDKTILFETAKEKFFDDYLEKLKEITDVESIDYLVVEHTEPDHAGSVERHENHRYRLRPWIPERDRKQRLYRNSGKRQHDNEDRRPYAPFPLCTEPALAGYHVYLY